MTKDERDMLVSSMRRASVSLADSWVSWGGVADAVGLYPSATASGSARDKPSTGWPTRDELMTLVEMRAAYGATLDTDRRWMDSIGRVREARGEPSLLPEIAQLLEAPPLLDDQRALLERIIADSWDAKETRKAMMRVTPGERVELAPLSREPMSSAELVEHERERRRQAEAEAGALHPWKSVLTIGDNARECAHCAKLVAFVECVTIVGKEGVFHPECARERR